jgi:NhaA family Na+:H+ antiporter
MISNAIREFFKLESAGGVVLFLAALVAVVLVNSGYHESYTHLQHLPITIGPLSLSLLHWVNDGLMAIFFLIVGMEIKREILEGELSRREQLLLPLIGAIGGMLLPAFIYYLCARESPESLRGWAIPSATDIAFALGVLSLFGKRVPVSLKVFLTALAILDDLGAILIIAFFYTEGINASYLGFSASVFAVLLFLGRRGVKNLLPFMILGLFLWFFVFKSGIHATIGGVALALAIPIRGATENSKSPLEILSHLLHPWVTFAILPLFAFLNAGVSLAGFSVEVITAPIPLGILLGLFVGKQFGIFGFVCAAIKLGWGKLPERSTWLQLFAVCVLAGIGFTMSLFIGGLAFPDEYSGALVRVGVISGSLLSTLFGAILLRISLSKSKQDSD